MNFHDELSLSIYFAPTRMRHVTALFLFIGRSDEVSPWWFTMELNIQTSSFFAP
jgi:hypothetical protein